MKNLEQVRAAAAMAACDKTSRQAVSKLPALILGNGLLAATAFATETAKGGGNKRPEMAAAMDAMASHLAANSPISCLGECENALGMLKMLSEKGSSLELQLATREALAFLGYLKRFATKDGTED